MTSSGPTWNLIKAKLDPDVVYYNGSVCKDLEIMAKAPIGSTYGDITASIRNIRLEKGNCLGDGYNYIQSSTTVEKPSRSMTPPPTFPMFDCR
jgi:hypothetical protein